MGKRLLIALVAGLLLVGAGFGLGYAAHRPSSRTIPSSAPSQIRLVRVPDVIGLSQKEATAKVEAAGLTVSHLYRNQWSGAPKGTIISEQPPAGSRVTTGAGLTLAWSVLCNGCSSGSAPPEKPGTVTRIFTKGWPADIAVDRHDVWATVPSRHVLLRIDPDRDVILSEIQLGPGGRPEGVALALGDVWVRVQYNSFSSVVRIDPSTDHIIASIPLRERYGGITVTRDGAWVTGHDRGIVQRIDPNRNKVASTLRVAGASGVLAYLGAIWVYANDGAMVKIDPQSNHIVGSPIGVGHSNVAAGAGHLWLASNDDVLEVDPSTTRVMRRIRVTACYPAPVGCSLVFGDGYLWMERSGAPPNDVYRIDPRTGRVRHLTRFAINYPSYLLAAGHATLWAAGPDAIWRIAE